VPEEPFTDADSGIYIDSSALVKLYVPEPESDELDAFLRGRDDLMISELCVTEVVSAASRRRREGTLSNEEVRRIAKAVLSDVQFGSFLRLDLSPAIHRYAERMLLGAEKTPLRTLDALHIALAVSAGAENLITFDDRMAEAAVLHGLRILRI
jgi:predicted nucleic acid-binding protein